MTVGYENSIEPPKTHARPEDLALCALAAVDEDAVLAKANDVGAEPAVNRRGRGRCAKEDELEQELP